MAKKNTERFVVELHNADGWQDTPEDDFKAYADAVSYAKDHEWLDGKHNNFVLVEKRTRVARIERPNPVVTKL